MKIRWREVKPIYLDGTHAIESHDLLWRIEKRLGRWYVYRYGVNHGVFNTLCKAQLYCELNN